MNYQYERRMEMLWSESGLSLSQRGRVGTEGPAWRVWEPEWGELLAKDGVGDDSGASSAHYQDTEMSQQERPGRPWESWL